MKVHKTLLIACFALLLFSCQPKAVLQPVQIIPEPLNIAEMQGNPFVVNAKSKIVIDNEMMLPAATFLKELLKTDIEIVFQDDAGNSKNDFVFVLNPDLDSLSAEGYKLTISKSGVLIASAGPQGLFYAVETIRQLLPAELETRPLEQIALPAVEITDRPRFAWRGMHLDVSRHFMPLGFVKKYIDYLAMHKLNVFHWHLVDGIG